jgi:hypothetical protein
MEITNLDNNIPTHTSTSFSALGTMLQLSWHEIGASRGLISTPTRFGALLKALGDKHNETLGSNVRADISREEGESPSSPGRLDDMASGNDYRDSDRRVGTISMELIDMLMSQLEVMVSVRVRIRVEINPNSDSNPDPNPNSNPNPNRLGHGIE